MTNKKEMNKSNSGFYEIIFKNTLPSKDWVYIWFIIKNLFKKFGFNLNNINDSYPEYLNIVKLHNGNLINKDTDINYNNDSLNKFSGKFNYFSKNKKITPTIELSDYLKKYFNANNIELKDIKIKNSPIKQINTHKEHIVLGFYNITIKKPIHPNEWTYHWFIIKNMFRKLNYQIQELNDNHPEYRYITGEDLFILPTFKNPKITKKDYLDTFEGFCDVYNYKKINISKKNLKEYENFRDEEIYKLKSFFIKYFQLNNIDIETINISKDTIYPELHY